MLIAYEVALEVVRELRPVDAAISTVQNLAEGGRHRGGNKRARFDIAHGEANEMKGSLDVALAWGYISDDSAARAKLRRLLARAES